MKRITIFWVLILIINACSKNKSGDMLVTGSIDGLSKGTVFLEKRNDSVLVVVDSVALFGKNTFKLSATIESPEMYFLSLDRNKEKSIPFFGEKGNITIHTKLDKFNYKAKITGSENQKLLEEFIKVKQRFSYKNLETIKARFEAQQKNETAVISEIDKQSEKDTRRKYLYAINFAINHADKEIAPYIAITELYNAQIKWLDSINNSLTPQIKTSKYGKSLDQFIKDIKINEAK